MYIWQYGKTARIIQKPWFFAIFAARYKKMIPFTQQVPIVLNLSLQTSIISCFIINYIFLIKWYFILVKCTCTLTTSQTSYVMTLPLASWTNQYLWTDSHSLCVYPIMMRWLQLQVWILLSLHSSCRMSRCPSVCRQVCLNRASTSRGF